MFENELKEFGFTENEAKIYLLLLQQGIMNPYEISKKLGLHRGYVYDALERMQEKGIISTIQKDNKKHFNAVSPENLLELQKLRTENLQKIIPDLIKLSTLQKDETKMELYKGRNTYRILLKDIYTNVKDNETVYILGIDEEILLNEVEPIYLKQYLNTMTERKFRERIIIRKGAKRVANKNIEYRELPGEYLGKIAQIIYGNKTAIFILGTPYNLLMIDSKEVSDTYRKQFELLWSVAK